MTSKVDASDNWADIEAAYHFVKQILSKFLFFLFLLEINVSRFFKNNDLTYQITNVNIYPVVYNKSPIFFPFPVVFLFYLVIYFLVIASYNVIDNKRSIIK